MYSHCLRRSILLTGLFMSAVASAQNEKATQLKAGGPDAFDSSRYRAVADRLIQAATESEFARRRLAELCDTFGPRFSGTTNLEAAIDWVLDRMKADGLENVHGE